MKVLALASYPVEAAATRYRLMQFVSPLKERDISLVVRPFLDSRTFANIYRRSALPQNIPAIFLSLLSRIRDFLVAGRFDALLVQREAMLFGPPVFEWLSLKLGRIPLILDLDDATYIRYISPTFGRMGSWLKFFGKTDELISWANVVTCGNRTIAEYVERKNKKAEIIPTVVDTDVFRPKAAESSDVPVIGWVGTHSTYPYLQKIFPVLQRLAVTYDFHLKIVGAGVGKIDLPHIAIENLRWNLEREAEDFQSFDIGLYPLDDALHNNWAAGKSGFKAIQYMAVGIPYVVTPIGACAEIGNINETHFVANDLDEWENSLSKLLNDARLREQMGVAGRKYALSNFTVPQQADKLARVLRDAVLSER
ncbi:MAG: glycosyltransferase family 4 protein [Pyrinomonadaceae bacterium]